MAKDNIQKKQEKGSKKPQTNAPAPAQLNDDDFAVSKYNYKLLLIGFGIIVLGFILMVGGGSKDPNVFNYDGLFGFQRRTLAPVLVLIGFAFEVYAIMKNPKKEDIKS